MDKTSKTPDDTLTIEAPSAMRSITHESYETLPDFTKETLNYWVDEEVAAVSDWSSVDYAEEPPELEPIDDFCSEHDTAEEALFSLALEPDNQLTPPLSADTKEDESSVSSPAFKTQNEASISITEDLPVLGDTEHYHQWVKTSEIPLNTLPSDPKKLKIMRKLGVGGMGVVYEVKQRLPMRRVALKKLTNPTELKRQCFIQEINTLGLLDHPNIIPVHEILFDDNGCPEMLMKQVKGKTLLEFIKASKKQIDTTWSLNVLIQVCHALEFAHSREIIHRDIKCENIMVGAFNEVYLMDWGLALNLRQIEIAPRGLVGTPSYMAPEMLTGAPKDVSTKTDIYLLGATLHHLLTGNTRHTSSSIGAALADAEKSQPHMYHDVSERLVGLINSSCHRNPTSRPQNVEQFRKELEAAIADSNALQVCEDISPAFEELKALVQANMYPEESTGISSRNSIDHLYVECRSRYQGALAISPDCNEAIAQIERLDRLMIAFERSRTMVERALSIALNINDHELVNQLQKEVQQKRKTQNLMRLNDPRFSEKGRRILLLSLSLGCILISAGGLTYNYFNGNEITAKRLMVSHSLLTLIVGFGIYLGRTSLLSTLTGRQLSKALILGSIGAALNSFAGHLTDTSSEQIMVVNIFILGITWANSAPVIKAGNWIFGMCLVMGLLALIWPAATYSLLLASLSLSMLWALWDWVQQQEEYEL